MWAYQGEEFTEEMIPEGAVGFVYVIRNRDDGRSYIGQKKFGAKRKTTVKGKTKRVYKKSDWQRYYGSNAELQADVERLGEDSFRREILHICKSKAEMNYLELQEQMDRRVILQPRLYYNAYVGGRISRRQLTALLT
jgi:hypothetical protein